MNKEEIEQKIVVLKNDYLLLQNNIEKLESMGGNFDPLEKRLIEIEKELQSLNHKLSEMKNN